MNGISTTLFKAARISSTSDPTGKPTAHSIPASLVTVTEPYGMEWDNVDQQTRFQNLIRTMRPDLSAHLVRGHGGGTTGSLVVRPRSRLATDPESLELNRLNTRSVADILAAAKRTHGKVPDLCFLGQCNKWEADVPKVVRDSMGALPSRLVYTAPGAYSNTSVSQPALEYALKTRRPILFPKEQEFSNESGSARVRALLQPLVPAGASIPLAAGGLAMLLNEGWQRYKKRKPSWVNRLAFGAGGAALGGLGLLLHRELSRRGAYDSPWISGFSDLSGEHLPLVRTV